MAMALLLSFVLARYQKEDRGSVKNTLALFLFAFVGQLFSAATEAIAGLPQAAETFYELFAIVIGLTLIRLWGMLIFRILLPWFRFRPPVILEDIVIAVGYFSWGLVRLRYAGMDLSGVFATSAAFRRAGIAMAMSEYDINLTKQGEKQEQRARSRELSQRRAALNNVSLFSQCTDEELDTISKRLVYAPFSRGEIITRQGDTADFLYILSSGDAEALVEVSGRQRKVGKITAGPVFLAQPGVHNPRLHLEIGRPLTPQLLDGLPQPVHGP